MELVGPPVGESLDILNQQLTKRELNNVIIFKGCMVLLNMLCTSKRTCFFTPRDLKGLRKPPEKPQPRGFLSWQVGKATLAIGWSQRRWVLLPSSMRQASADCITNLLNKNCVALETMGSNALRFARHYSWDCVADMFSTECQRTFSENAKGL